MILSDLLQNNEKLGITESCTELLLILKIFKPKQFFGNGLFEIRSTLGDTHPRGDDFDKFETREMKNNEAVISDLRPILVGPKPFDTTLTSVKFAELGSDLLDRLLSPVETALSDAKPSFKDIDDVISWLVQPASQLFRSM
nr:heat shock 70 kda protein 6, chloroplastic [Quercus suber]